MTKNISILHQNLDKMQIKFKILPLKIKNIFNGIFIIFSPFNLISVIVNSFAFFFCGFFHFFFRKRMIFTIGRTRFITNIIKPRSRRFLSLPTRSGRLTLNFFNDAVFLARSGLLYQNLTLKLFFQTTSFLSV